MDCVAQRLGGPASASATTCMTPLSLTALEHHGQAALSGGRQSCNAQEAARPGPHEFSYRRDRLGWETAMEPDVEARPALRRGTGPHIGKHGRDVVCVAGPKPMVPEDGVRGDHVEVEPRQCRFAHILRAEHPDLMTATELVPRMVDAG